LPRARNCAICPPVSDRTDPNRKARAADSAAPDSIAHYPMPSDTSGIAQPGLFHVVRSEHGQDKRITGFQAHRHDFFEIIWIRSGSGVVRSDLHSYPIRPRTLFFASPGQVHAWEFDGKMSRELASFTAELFSVSSENPGILGKLPFLYSGAVEPILQMNAGENRQIERVFRCLHAEATEPAPGRDDLVRAYLTIVLTLARQFFSRRARQAEVSPPVADLLSRRFRLALEEHFPRLLSVGDYARFLGVSRNHLNDHLQSDLGRSASEIIHERIVLEAKRLLTHTTLTSAEIAYRLRFQDPSYFGRFFRRSTLKTPGEYRDHARSDMRAG